jgi:metal-sulfur cluster biosynthetic enzyme
VSVRRDEVLQVLDQVVDPCSAAQGRPLGLVELGLVSSVSIEDGRAVRVRLVTTSPGCRFGPTMAEAAEAAIRGLKGVGAATVEIDTASVWTEARMAPEAAEHLAVARARASEGLRPYDWSRR